VAISEPGGQSHARERKKQGPGQRTELRVTIVLLLVAALVFVAETTERATGPVLATFQVIDASQPGQLRWAGGVVELEDGIWVLAYERVDALSSRPAVYVRESTDPLGRFGPEVVVSDPVAHPAYDPSLLRTSDGRTYVLWSGDNAAWASERLRPGTFTPGRKLFSGGQDHVEEVLGYSAGGRDFFTYDWRPGGAGVAPFDACLRRVSAGLRLGPQVVIAKTAVGAGREGLQDRIALVQTGTEGGLLAAWNGLPDALGSRPIVGSLSSDYGATWGPPFVLAQFSDPNGVSHDLVDPTAVYVSAHDLRLYFAQDRASYGLGYARSTDQGATWMRFDVTTAPPGVGNTHMFVVVDRRPDGSMDLIAFANAERQTLLGGYLLETISTHQSD
jgi:hypothetical protein